MTSKPIQQMQEWAANFEDKWRDHYEKTGKAGHPGFTEFFHAVHEDGSTFTLPDCYVVKHHLDEWDDTFIVVFTEHQGTFIFPQADLVWYSRYEHRTTIPELDDDHQPIED